MQVVHHETVKTKGETRSSVCVLDEAKRARARLEPLLEVRRRR